MDIVKDSLLHETHDWKSLSVENNENPCCVIKDNGAYCLPTDRPFLEWYKFKKKSQRFSHDLENMIMPRFMFPSLLFSAGDIYHRYGTYNKTISTLGAWVDLRGHLRNLSVGKTILVGTNSANDVIIRLGVYQDLYETLVLFENWRACLILKILFYLS